MTSTNSTSHNISIQNSLDSEYSNSTGQTTKASSQSQIHGLQQFQSQQRSDDHSRSPAHPSGQRDKPFRRKSFSEFSYDHQPEEGASTYGTYTYIYEYTSQLYSLYICTHI
jgi:hypothetical protein